jgi:hypothetical protein
MKFALRQFRTFEIIRDDDLEGAALALDLPRSRTESTQPGSIFPRSNVMMAPTVMQALMPLLNKMHDMGSFDLSVSNILEIPTALV